MQKQEYLLGITLTTYLPHREPSAVNREPFKICVMKKIVIHLVALSLLCAIVSCSRTVQVKKEMDSLQSVVQSSTVHPPTTAERKIRKTDISYANNEPCIPDFDPAPVTANNCLNHCQWVYEGWASTAHNTIHVNCIDNPSNWSLMVKSSGENKYFQFRVFHEPINYANYPNGAGLCSRDLIFEPFPSEDGSLPCIEYWECYEPGLFNFRVTARMELPIWTS
jgi:hypothetical protein